MNTLAITFSAWNAWQQSQDAPEQWARYGSNHTSSTTDSLPKAQRIPPMLRRRLGSLGKAAIASAEDTISDIPVFMPTVFCSQHGDLHRTLSLLESLAENEPLSPTHFSLSVHNAIAGIYSIARKDPSPTSAICCSVDDVSAALLETQMILNEQQCQYALCVVHDEPLPEFYGCPNRPASSYAASFLLTSEPNESSLTLGLSLSKNDSSHSDSLSTQSPSAVEMVNFLNQKNQDSQAFPSREKIWTWRKQTK
jgi:Beta-ketoacyl synthase, N-terminal domain